MKSLRLLGDLFGMKDAALHFRDSQLDGRRMQRKSTKVFISYASEDDNWRSRLVTHLKHLGDDVEIWDRSQIQGGVILDNRLVRNINRGKKRW